MPQIAEAQALLGALAETEEVKAAEAQRQRRLHLQTQYGQAMMWAKGFAADETLAAYAQARELAARSSADEDRYAIYYGQWLGLHDLGALRESRATAEAFLADAAAAGKRMETAVAHRTLALNCFLLGEFAEARSHALRAIELDDPARSAESRFRFGLDCRIGALGYLALANWQIGEVDEASRLFQEALTQAATTGHVQTVANTGAYKAAFDAARGDAVAADRTASMVFALSREHGMEYFIAWSEMPLLWAQSRLGDGAAGAPKLRQAVANFMAGRHRLLAPFYTGLLAELDAEGPDLNDAAAKIDDAIALAQQTGERWTDSMLHRIRGEILLKRDPANRAPAEEAFHTAIAVAREQGARSFGLQAALKVVKLYLSTSRPAEAHTVLAPALEGFAPTPEMPEIAEAQAVLAALAENDEVKSAAAARQRRLKLQTDYSRALLWSKGFSAGETSAALADASKLAAGTADFAERFAGYYGAWIGSLSRGDLAQARRVAETFAREAKGEAHLPGLARACLCLGVTSFIQGEFAGAWTQLEEALRTYDPSWDRDAKLRFGPDAGIVATAFLANTSWLMGEVARARELIEQAVARAIQSEDVPSKVNVYVRQAVLEAVRGDAEAVLPVAGTLVELSQEYGLAQWLAWGKTFHGWAKARLGGRDVGVRVMQEGIVVLAEQESKLHMPFIQGLLADIESEIDENALSRIDGALALATETGQRWSDSFLHRIRGEILLKLDPANAAAEQAFRAAIAIAQAQKARSFELQASLGLARLYQSTARPADAHAVLASALEGFSPTPEMPEIGEAQALLECLAHGGEGAIASKGQATEG
jgi:predicted ATPase